MSELELVLHNYKDIVIKTVMKKNLDRGKTMHLYFYFYQIPKITCERNSI